MLDSEEGPPRRRVLMGNVNLPTPVALAAGGICILGGYLLGWVSGPDAPTRTTAVVESFDPDGDLLCLSGEAVEEQEGAVEDETLCGTWRRTAGSVLPEQGDDFRFVSIVVDSSTSEDADGEPVTVIYGDVVG
jgi:uncharacterized cupin superfamily protein